jgi:hypothetical protein
MSLSPSDPVPAQRYARFAPIIFGVLTLGVAVRTAHYFANRSLWLDEAMLALNIGERSFAGLLDPLAFNQAAPLGFLWLEKLAVSVLGVGEMALRLFPLIAAIVALFLFAVLARRLLAPYAALAVIVLFALSTSQVYFAAEVKQYSFDVLWAILILLLGHHAAESGADRGGSVASAAGSRRGRLTTLAVVGAIGVWFSHPLIFALPAALAYVVIERRRVGVHAGESAARGPLLVAAAWTGSFALAYFLAASDASQGALMQRFWAEGFMPLPPRSVAEWAWFGQAFGDLIRNTYDFTERIDPTRAVADALGGIFLLVGVVYLARGRRPVLVLLGTPIVLALLAAALSVYPFRGRLIQFLVPSSILLIAFGIESAWSLGAQRTTGWLAAISRTSAAMAAAICLLSAIVLFGWLGAPYREESRPVFEYVAERSRPDDLVYLHSGARHAFEYYNRYCRSCRPRASTIHRGRLYGPEGEARLHEDLDALRDGSRVWVVFAHEWWTWGATEKRLILARMERSGSELDRLVAPGASAHLFALD